MTKSETFRHVQSMSLLDVMLIFVLGMVLSITVALTAEWLAQTSFTFNIIEQLLPAGEKSAWYLSRASGVVAYFFLSGSVIWGLMLSTKLVKEWLAPPLALALHNSCSWMAVGLAAFHELILLFDSYFDYSIPDLLIPFTGPYRPASVGIGIISFYGLLLIASSFQARKWLGQRNWRRLHYLSFVFYLLVTAHGITAGSDSGTPVLQVIYAASALSVLFLVNYRLLTLPKNTSLPAAKTGSTTARNNRAQ